MTKQSIMETNLIQEKTEQYLNKIKHSNNQLKLVT